MVTVINYKKAMNAEEQEFFLLVVQGGVQSVVSKETGRVYLTAKKATVSSTFDENTCKSLIGTQLPGNVEKKEVDPYAYVIKETGEEIELNHRYEYNPSIQSMEEAVAPKANSEQVALEVH
jgi:hypothetical protein